MQSAIVTDRAFRGILPERLFASSLPGSSPKEAESVKARDLIERHDRSWREAIRHRFLDGVSTGTLPAGAFETWLVQDYLFVLGGLAFQSRPIPRAPRRDQALLIGGLAALEAELGWFEAKARERGLALDEPPTLRTPPTASSSQASKTSPTPPR